MAEGRAGRPLINPIQWFENHKMLQKAMFDVSKICMRPEGALVFTEPGKTPWVAGEVCVGCCHNQYHNTKMQLVQGEDECRIFHFARLCWQSAYVWSGLPHLCREHQVWRTGRSAEGGESWSRVPRGVHEAVRTFVQIRQPWSGRSEWSSSVRRRLSGRRRRGYLNGPGATVS